MADHQTQGYIRDGAHRRPQGPVWCLPALPVVKPGRARLVWDAAAEVGGVSLNSFLLAGPDLPVTLPKVLWRSREGRVVVTVDVAEMSHQVRMWPADRGVM